MADAFSTGNTINVGNIKNDPRYFIAVEETKSELVVPMAFQGNIIGVINSESEEEDHYTTEIINKVSCISRDLSIAFRRIGYISNMKANQIPYIHI